MSNFKLTHENYFSNEANKLYMSNSQYKSFLDCEAKEMAKLNGKWMEKDRPCFLEGHYGHAWNEGKLNLFKMQNPSIYKHYGSIAWEYNEAVNNNTLDIYKENNPKIFTKNGQLYAQYQKIIDNNLFEMKAEFKHLDKIIEVMENDVLFMRSLQGQKEVIFTAELFGLNWKIVIDSYFPEEKRFTDLKIIEKLKKTIFNEKYYGSESVFDAYGYLTQIAIYTEIERLANNRAENDYFEPFIAVATKQKEPDKDILCCTSDHEPINKFITTELIEIKRNTERIKLVKEGKEEPERCDNCAYCRTTKVLTFPTHYSYYRTEFTKSRKEYLQTATNCY